MLTLVFSVRDFGGNTIGYFWIIIVTVDRDVVQGNLQL